MLGVMGNAHEYRFRRQNCVGSGVHEVSISFELGEHGGDQFRFANPLCGVPSDVNALLKEGAIEAFEENGVDARKHTVTIRSIEEHASGNTSRVFYKICLKHGVTEALGFGDRNPFNGVYDT